MPVSPSQLLPGTGPRWIMVCRSCGGDGLRREHRVGFLQNRVFPLFGLYPWECCFCRRVKLYHKHFPDPEDALHWPGDAASRAAQTRASEDKAL